MSLARKIAAGQYLECDDLRVATHVWLKGAFRPIKRCPRGCSGGTLLAGTAPSSQSREKCPVCADAGYLVYYEGSWLQVVIV